MNIEQTKKLNIIYTFFFIFYTIGYQLFSRKFPHDLVALIVAGSYLFFLPSQEKQQSWKIITLLKKYKLDLFNVKYLKEIGIRQFLNPFIFAGLSFTSLLIITVGWAFGQKLPYRQYALFIPLILLSVGHSMRYLMYSTKPLWRKTRKHLLNLYHYNPHTTRILSFGIIVLSLMVTLTTIFVGFKSSFYKSTWYQFCYQDKRVVFFTYIAVEVIFLFYFYMLFAWKNNINAEQTSELKKSSYRQIFFSLVAGLALAFFLWGPPWNVYLLGTFPDIHETQHLGSLQAIKQGCFAYTEAEIQYGPGSQLFLYYYLNKFGWDLLSFREAWLLLDLISLVFFLSIVFSSFKFLEALACLSLLSMGYFTIFWPDFDCNGVGITYFGWYNGFRYLAPLFLSISAWKLLYQWRFPTLMTFLVGFIYGFLCYMAQENLSCGFITITTCILLSLALRLLNMKAVIKLGVSFALGFCLFVLPILFFYFSKGQLGLFIGRYFAVSSLVVNGYSNTSWASGWSHCEFPGYVFIPVILFSMVISVQYFRKKETLFKLSSEEIRFLFVSISPVVLHQIALLRADSTHFAATTISLPIAIVLFMKMIFVTSKKSGRWKEFLVAVGILFLIFPLNLNLPNLIQNLSKIQKKFHPNIPQQDANQFMMPIRLGYPILKHTPYRTFEAEHYFEEMENVHRIIENKPTVVVSMPGLISSGAVYFFADLVVGTPMTETAHSVLNSQDRKRWLEHIQTANYSSMIVEKLDTEEAKIFLNRFPTAKIIKRCLESDYYILLKNE